MKELNLYVLAGGVHLEPGGQPIEPYYDAGGNLHADFRLSADGEYLALVQPDGTVAHQYVPEYPQQYTDVSYGLAQVVTEFVPEKVELSYLVPSDGSLGTTWTEKSFDESSWTGGLQIPPVLVTEAGTGTPDYVEIENLHSEPVDTSGWVVAVNRPNLGITGVAGWSALPSQMDVGEVICWDDVDARWGHLWEGRTEGDDYKNIPFSNYGPGWVMIVDDEGRVVDFVAWGDNEGDIANMAGTGDGF